MQTTCRTALWRAGTKFLCFEKVTRSSPHLYSPLCGRATGNETTSRILSGFFTRTYPRPLPGQHLLLSSSSSSLHHPHRLPGGSLHGHYQQDPFKTRIPNIWGVFCSHPAFSLALYPQPLPGRHLLLSSSSSSHPHRLPGGSLHGHYQQEPFKTRIPNI